MDALVIQGVVPNYPGVKKPAVTPKVATTSVGKRGGGGGSFLSPTEPLYSAPPCPLWKPSKDIIDKVFSKGKTKYNEPDPLEVLRDVKKTEEKVKKSELRALRRRYAQLSKEAEGLRTSREALDAALKRIVELEHQLRCLQQDLNRIESLRWQPVTYAPRWKPAHAVEKGARQQVKALAEPASAQDRTLLAIRRGLPFVGASGVLALLTFFVIPDEKRTLKFAGYGGSTILLYVGLHVALDELLEPSPITPSLNPNRTV